MLIERRYCAFLKLQNASLMSRNFRWKVEELRVHWNEVTYRVLEMGVWVNCEAEVLAAAVIGPCFRKSSHPGRKEN